MSDSRDRPVSWPDLFAPAFGFVLELQQLLAEQTAVEPPRAAALMQRAREELRSVESRARDARLREEPVNQAKFAVASLIDETVLSSRWSMRDDWCKQPLTIELFRESNAGEEFFRRIEILRRVARPDAETLGALDVYATCIAMGFRGKYADGAHGEELREILQESAAAVVQGRDCNRLSPSWHHPESVAARVARMPGWIMVAAVAGVVTIVLGALELRTQSQADNLVSFLQGSTSGIGARKPQ